MVEPDNLYYYTRHFTTASQSQPYYGYTVNNGRWGNDAYSVSFEPAIKYEDREWDEEENRL